MATVSDITTVQYSGDFRVDSLLWDGAADWNYLLPFRTTLNYTFDLSFASGKVDGLSTFNASQQLAAQSILAYVSSVTGINFAQVATGSSADFHFANTNLAGSSTAGLCQTLESWSPPTGDVLVAYNAEAIVMLDNVEFFSINNTLSAGSSGYEVLLHEIGHALGLGHPFEGPKALPGSLDNTNNTVMSYTEAGANKSTYQSYDLLALGWIYGEDGLGGSFGYNSTNGPSLANAGTTPTGASLVTAIQSSTGVTLNAVLQATLTARLQQMFDTGTYSALAASVAMQAFSTSLKAVVDANGGTGAFLSHVSAVVAALNGGTEVPGFGAGGASAAAAYLDPLEGQSAGVMLLGVHEVTLA